MIDYVCPTIFLIVIGYLVYQHAVNRKKSDKAEKINADYKNILDSKLIPIGFERQQISNDAREKINSYSRDILAIILHFEPPFFSNQVYSRSGKKITLQEHINKMPAEIKNKTIFLQENDKNKLVDSADFVMELSDSEESKTNVIQTLDKWLAENPLRSKIN